MFFHALFISPSALSESPTLGQGEPCRKDPEVSFLFIQETMKPPGVLRAWHFGGTWRNTKMNEFHFCPPRVRIHPDNSCWSAAVSELPSWASLTSLSLTLGPRNYLLFLDWGWPCQKAACYTEDMSTSHQHSLVSCRTKKKLSEKTEGNLLAVQRLGLCTLTDESLHKRCSQKKTNPEACVSPDCSHLQNREAQPHHLLLKSNSDAQHQESSFYGKKAQPLHVWSRRLVGKVAYAISETRHF